MDDDYKFNIATTPQRHESKGVLRVARLHFNFGLQKEQRNRKNTSDRIDMPRGEIISNNFTFDLRLADWAFGYMRDSFMSIVTRLKQISISLQFHLGFSHFIEQLLPV